MSRRTLTLTVWTTALVLAAVAVVIVLQQTNSTPDPSTSTTPTENTSTRAPSTPSDSPTPTTAPSSETVRSDGQPTSSSGWRETARSFGTAYTNTAGGHDAWLARLRPHISPGLADGFDYTDLVAIPTGQLTGIEKLDQTPGQGIRVRVTYNNAGADSDITLTTNTAGEWVVTTIIPAENDGAAT